MSTYVVEVNDADFETEVSQAELPVIVDFGHHGAALAA